MKQTINIIDILLYNPPYQPREVQDLILAIYILLLSYQDILSLLYD